MTRFRSILVATDFSDDATHAVRRAAVLAAQHAARLTLLHVVHPAGFQPLRQWFSPSIDVDLKTAQARATLRQFAAEIRGRHGVPARFRVVVGESFEEIRRAADGTDLLVLGQRGRNPLKDLVTGSTADRLLRFCRRPMLVVKQPLVGPYRRVVVPIDFSTASVSGLRLAGAIAPRASIEVLHALDSSEAFEMQLAGVPAADIRRHGETQDRTTQARIRDVVSQAGLASARVSAVVRRGPAWACTLSHVESYGSDLIVVGKQGASTIADFFLGSVTRRLLSSATCDLLVLPRSAERSEEGTLGASKARPCRHHAPPLATQPYRTDPWTTKH
jgi:nucleotide-binding universal stress UspA family protein